MLIQSAIRSIDSTPDRWVRVDLVRKLSGGLEVCFSIHSGRRGKRVEGLRVICRGVYEAKISDMNGGGLRIYRTTHPAAHQYVARFAELRWPRTCDEAQVFLALHRAHTNKVDDWIPFERYLFIETPWTGTSFQPHFAPVSGSNFVCRGPDFLVLAYAKALEKIGIEVKLTFRIARKPKPNRPKVLHFGGSYVVADAFSAERILVAVE